MSSERDKMDTFWKKQTTSSPLFPDIEWNKPQQRSKAGKLAIVGGNKLGFVAVGDAYGIAKELGAGHIRAVMPDALKRTIPSSITDAYFVPSNTSGGFSRDALPELIAACQWADVCLLVGDSGRNSETAMAFESLLSSYDGHIVITRDAVDLIRPASSSVVARPNTTLVLSFAQLQKLFQSVYYPKILSFSMQLMQLVDILHKFTLTYPVTIVTFHQSQLIVAHDGRVVSQEFDEPMAIWRGITAAKAASYLLWTPKQPLEAITASITH
jgi:NAD(P)H-hydrate repair Nnr-like enzyme with NAD(P)H-hydrate dehydratase domain